MAELNFPKLTPEEIKPVEENMTGAGATVPTPVIDQPVIETPVVTEPIIQETPEVEAPIVETPVIETPQVTETVVTPEVKVETPKIETPKANKVETVQDIETKTIQNDSADIKLQEEKRNKTIAETNALVQNGASIDEIVKFGANNPDNRDIINSTLKGAFKNASNLEFFGKYSTLNNEDMYASYQSGQVVPGSEQYNLLPPEKKASFDAFLKEKEAANITEKTDYTASNAATDFTELNSQIPKMFNSTVRENYQKALNTPKLLELNAKAANKQLELDKLDIEMETLQEDMEKQLAGNLPGSVRAEIRQSYNEKIREKRLKLAEYNSFASQINSIRSQAETELKIAMYEDGIAREEYQTQLSLYETRRQEMRADLSAEQKAEIDRENMIFTAKNKALAEDTQFQRDIALLEYKAKLADEGVTGEWQERDDGMYFLKSDGTADKVLEAVNIPGVTTNTVFENGQAYTEVYDINNQGVGFTSQNTSLGAKERELLNAPNGTRIPTRLSKDQLSPNNPGGKECGEYVNDIMARTVGQKIGSTWQSKLNYANESTGDIGSVAVWKVNPNVEDKYGHTGIIVGQTQDKSQWLIKSSNIKGQGVVSLVKVPKTAINGYKGTGVIGTERVVTESQKTLLDAIDTVDLVKKDNKAALKQAGLTLNDALKYKSENVATAKKEDYKTALSLIDKMMSAGDGDGFSDAIGLFSWARNTSDSGEITFDPGTDAADFKAQFDALVDGLTLPNLDKMSGVLTDKDIELLKNASKGGLSLTMSEKDFKKSVEDLKGALNRAVKGVKLPEGQVVYKDDDGIEYDKDTLTEALQKEIELYNNTNGKQGASQEDVKQFIIRNNLTTKLQ